MEHNLTSDVWIGLPPSSGGWIETRTWESDEAFFSDGRCSSSGTRSYTLTSVTGMGTRYTVDVRTTMDVRGSTDARTLSSRTDTGLVTREGEIEIGRFGNEWSREELGKFEN